MAANPVTTRSPTRQWFLIAAVFAGGVTGTAMRAGLLEAFPPGGGWPTATFVANLAGTAALAVLAGLSLCAPGVGQGWRAFAGTGVCGALTTFAAVPIEVIMLARDGRGGVAATYLGLSVIGGLLIAAGVVGTIQRMSSR